MNLRPLQKRDSNALGYLYDHAVPITMIALLCAACSAPFERRPSDYNKALKRGQSEHFCSAKCHNDRQRTGRLTKGVCEGCGSGFTRKRGGGADKRRFCSQPCSNKATAQGRKKIRECAECGRKLWCLTVQCQGCKAAEYSKTTLGELRSCYSTAAFHAKVRGLARRNFNGPWLCAACGYSRHVDVCHMRDVASFPPDATLAQVNEPGNLIALDKRCHWEFDNGYLAYENGKIVQTGKP